MTYKVVLVKHASNYTVTVPALPGCISEGDSEAEALANIQDAIAEWLEYHQEEGKDPDAFDIEDIHVAEVEVRPSTGALRLRPLGLGSWTLTWPASS